MTEERREGEKGEKNQESKVQLSLIHIDMSTQIPLLMYF